MKRITTHSLLIFTIFLIFISCSKSETIDTSTPPPDKEDNSIYEWEKNRTSLLENNDMVLLYSGGAHRDYTWDEELIQPYVTYTDELGKEHWMFDSFLFLEIHNGNGKSFATGYQPVPANQRDWKGLVDHYFQSRICMGAINRSIESAKVRLGDPKEKRKVVIGIPEPIKTQKDWGSVKNGVTLDFSKSKDRVAACEWYIDYARQKFKEMNYNNIELAGFYWIAEEATNTRAILSDLSTYLNKLKYSVHFIPRDDRFSLHASKHLLCKKVLL